MALDDRTMAQMDRVPFPVADSYDDYGIIDLPFIFGQPQGNQYDEGGFKDNLIDEFTTPQLDKLTQKSWLMAKLNDSHVSSLGEHVVQGRMIEATTSSELHLMLTFDRVLLKPIPMVLLSYKFWEDHLVKETSQLSGPHRKDIVNWAKGFLRSYSYLIQHESDYHLAMSGDIPLFPQKASYLEFFNFIRWFQPITNSEVSPRYMYGEIKLNLFSGIYLGLNFEQRCAEPRSMFRSAFTEPPFAIDDELHYQLGDAPDTPRTVQLNASENNGSTLPGNPRIKLYGPNIGPYLQRDITTPKLDKLASRLWIAGESNKIISGLRDQRLNRQISVTVNPELHLVETKDKLFIKPIPIYLFSHDFWKSYICDLRSPLPNDSRSKLAEAASGFLRSYFYLIRRRADFHIATESVPLIPDGIDYIRFMNFVANFEKIPDRDVSPRYLYGVLRQTRLNLLSSVTAPPFLNTINRYRMITRRRACIERGISHGDLGVPGMSYYPPLSVEVQLYSKDILRPFSLPNDAPAESRKLPGVPHINLDEPYLGCYLQRDLTTPNFDKHAWKLFLIAKNTSSEISSLTDHAAQGRRIVITEDPELHLAETKDCIFVKPIPKYLVSRDFWAYYLCRETSPIPRDILDTVNLAARVFLNTYLALILQQSDFDLANRWKLLPEETTYTMFAHFARYIEDEISDTSYSVVYPRYMYGELKGDGFWSMLFSYGPRRPTALESRLNNLFYKSPQKPSQSLKVNEDLNHDVYLPRENDMGRDSYWRLIQNLNEGEFARFANSITRQRSYEREQGKVTLVDFLDGGKRNFTNFKNSRELKVLFERENWESAHTPSRSEDPAQTTTRTPRRRLFILEGLPWNYVGTLGSKLRIFPSIFATHYESNFTYSLDTIYSNKAEKRQLSLMFTNMIDVSSLWFPKHGDDPVRFGFGSTILRRLMLPGFNEQLGIRDQIAELDGAISYWSRKNHDGGWDAVMIVDPPFTKLDLNEAPRAAGDNSMASRETMFDIVHGPNLSDRFDVDPEVLDGNLRPATTQTSDYDNIVSHYAHTSDIIEKAVDCTLFIRNLVISKWVADLNHIKWQSMVTTAGFVIAGSGAEGTPSLSKVWAPKWTEGLFNLLMRWQSDLRMRQRRVEASMRSVGIDPDDPSSFGMVGPVEAGQWQYIHNKLAEYHESFSTMANNYTQVMGVRESQTSNNQARSAGYLTVLGTLFVPVSIITGILSMGGDFLPGENQFWIFLTLALPIFLFSCLCLFTNFIARVKRAWKHISRSMAKQKSS